MATLRPGVLRLSLRFAANLRPLVSFRKSAVVAALVLAVMVSSAAHARSAPKRKHPHLQKVRHLLANVGLPGAGFLPDEDEDSDVPEDGKKYELHLAQRGGEAVDVVYRVGNTYIPEAVEKLSQLLHDSHNNEVKIYDPRTFDVLHTMLAKLNRPGSVIQILSGYRTKETNDALRASGTTNAAEHSQHIEGKAIDIRVEGVPARDLRDAALSLNAGGVGYYPAGQFVHVDTGPVREWVYAPRKVSRKVKGSRGRGHARHRRHRA